MSKAIFQAYQWRFFPEKVFSMCLLLWISFSFPVFAKFTAGMLDQTEVPPPMYTEMKCGACPCSNPCTQQVTPPQPSPPPPLPPPPPKVNCSPPAALTETPSPPRSPPPPRFIYVTGVPGESSQSDSNHYNWIYYYSGVAERPMDSLGLALWGSVSAVFMIGFLQ